MGGARASRIILFARFSKVVGTYLRAEARDVLNLGLSHCVTLGEVSRPRFKNSDVLNRG